MDQDALTPGPDTGEATRPPIATIVWIAVRLVAVFYFGRIMTPFFYQGF